MIRHRGLGASLERSRNIAAQTALLSLAIIFVMTQFSLYEEEAEEEQQPIATRPRLVCPRCQRQRMARGKRDTHCMGTVLHPHGRVSMEPQQASGPSER